MYSVHSFAGIANSHSIAIRPVCGTVVASPTARNDCCYGRRLKIIDVLTLNSLLGCLAGVFVISICFLPLSGALLVIVMIVSVVVELFGFITLFDIKVRLIIHTLL